jgi:CRISPR-associated protein Cmr5
MSNLKLLEQGRAEFAFTCAKEGSENSQKNKYKSHVKKMPMMIKTSGLGAAAAFAFSKTNGSDKTWNLMITHIENWLINNGNLETGDKLHSKAISLDSSNYRALTIEVLAFLNWLRRFAEGLIEGEDDE